MKHSLRMSKEKNKGRSYILLSHRETIVPSKCFPSRRLSKQLLSGAGLPLHLHSPPKRHISLDLFGGRFRIGVVPGRIVIEFSIYFDVEITGGALPRTDRLGGTGLKIFLLKAVWRKVLVIFHVHGLATFGEHHVFPR